MILAGGFLWLNLSYDCEKESLNGFILDGVFIPKKIKAYGWPISTFRVKNVFVSVDPHFVPIDVGRIENKYLFVDAAFALIVMCAVAISLEWRIRESPK